MKSLYTAVALVLVGLVPVFYSQAGDTTATGNPYASIAKRNVFGLVPIVVTSPPQNPDSGNLPLIVPNGIITVTGVREVLYKVLGSGKPTQRHDVNAFIATEGQETDGIKVVKIDVNSEAITFENHGVIQKILLPLVANRVAFSWLNKIH